MEYFENNNDKKDIKWIKNKFFPFHPKIDIGIKNVHNLMGVYNR